MPITDIVLELASTKLFQARWSSEIHEEWIAAVRRDRPDLPAAALERRRQNMDRALPQARVVDYGHLVAALNLPDPNDRHVLAAAIVGRADVIVTFNVTDFPQSALTPHALEVQNPDEFLNHQRTLDETCFLQCVKSIRERLSKPKYSAEAYIENLRGCRLCTIAAELWKWKGLI